MTRDSVRTGDGTPSREDAPPSPEGDGTPSREDARPSPEGDGVPLDVDAESGPAAFMQALRVPRNGKVGVAVGLLFAVAVFVFFVVIPGSFRSPLWYLALGFVLAVSTAGIVAFVLTLARAVRLSRDL